MLASYQVFYKFRSVVVEVALSSVNQRSSLSMNWQEKQVLEILRQV